MISSEQTINQRFSILQAVLGDDLRLRGEQSRRWAEESVLALLKRPAPNGEEHSQAVAHGHDSDGVGGGIGLNEDDGVALVELAQATSRSLLNTDDILEKRLLNLVTSPFSR